MKKFLLLIFFVFLLGRQVAFGQSATNIYSTDFESGQGLWSVTNGLWEWGAPVTGVGPDAAHSGTNLIGTNLDGNYPPNASTMLKSPLITLPPVSGNQQIWLRFYYWFDFHAFFNDDSARVQLSSNGAAFQTISSYAIKGSGATAWSQFSVNISQFAGTTIQTGILFTSNGSSASVDSGIYLDDFSIEVLDVPFFSPITFENPDELLKLQVTSGLWEFGVPTDIGPAYEGNACAGTNFNGNYDVNSNTCLELPEVLLTPTPGQTPFFSFYHYFDFHSFFVDDYGVVEISSDGGNTWSELSNQFFGASEAWTYWGTYLSEYSGQSIKMRFCFHSDISSASVATGWYIDNISFMGVENVFVPTHELSLPLIAESITHAGIVFSSRFVDPVAVQLVNSTGVCVFSEVVPASAGKNFVSFSTSLHIPAGIYICLLNGERSGFASKKCYLSAL
ncbi:hypothetical protein C7N43_31685 [Sphingobacteriales bacterium UPWRP_1]|nr:hypothetical protein BVG80_01510 [Sphingobacteriales bacterium TSM_CSM]PSJ72928.1 hypothetical protein C7N43_31685 [Sphingobacteriales bacterium UPWRP_1]